MGCLAKARSAVTQPSDAAAPLGRDDEPGLVRRVMVLHILAVTRHFVAARESSTVKRLLVRVKVDGKV